MKKSSRWPLSIIGMIALFAVGLFAILFVSFKYVSANSENLFFDKYRSVDNNYNNLIMSNSEFLNNFKFEFKFNNHSKEKIRVLKANEKVEFFQHGFIIGENEFVLDLKDKNNNMVKNAKIELLLTRFETSDFDKILDIYLDSNGEYRTKKFEIIKAGRWKAIAKIQIDSHKAVLESNPIYAQ